MIVETVQDQPYQEFFETRLDRGEASVMALAKEKTDSLIILDDLKGRKVAQELNFVCTGTRGIIRKAKEAGHGDWIKPISEKNIADKF